MADTQHTHEPPPATRTRVRKVPTYWRVECPCGYTWSTRHQRLAVKFAAVHSHWPVS